MNRSDITTLLARGAGALTIPLGGRTLSLSLRRSDVLAPDARLTVTTDRGTFPFQLDGALFEGGVEGEPRSRAFLVVTKDGCDGTLERSGIRYRITAAGATRSALDENTAPPLGTEALGCGASETLSRRVPTVLSACDAETRCDHRPALNLGVRLVCGLAVECDHGLYTRFNGSVTNAANYAQALLGLVSSVYRDSINVILQVNALHVWASQDSFLADNVDTENANFKAWADASLAGVRRRAAVLLAGRQGWSGQLKGFAAINSICDSSRAYATAAVQGTSLPVLSGDRHVLAHELGHIFGAWHTFDCAWRDNCYLGSTYPPNTVISVNTSHVGEVVEGGCCSPLPCDPELCEDCLIPNACPVFTDCNDLHFTSDVMAYGGGLSLHDSIEVRMREKTELGLPPAAIADLGTSSTCTTITLTWTAPPGAQAYDLRVSSQAITTSNFSSATPVTTGTPQPSGSLESYTFTYGKCSGVKHYAIRWLHPTFSWSAISDETQGATGCPHPPAQCDDGGGEAASRPVVDAELTIHSAIPVRDRVSMSYAVPPGAESFELAVYDVTGRLVRLLGRGAASPGRYPVEWDLHSDGGVQVRGGVYFVRLKLGGVVLSRVLPVIR